MFSSQNDLDMVECPYNNSHRMLRKRLQSHLIKCRVNYPDVELQKCPFNQTHLIPEPEFVHHVTSCSDRKLITQYKYDAPEVKKEECVKHEPIECEDNWDNTEANDYNPEKYLENSSVLRKPIGVQPAQRKAFIKEERKRLGDCDSDDEAPEGSGKLTGSIRGNPCYSNEVLIREGSLTPPPPTVSNWHLKSHNSRTRDSDRPKAPTQWHPPNFRPSECLNNEQSRRQRQSSGYALDDDPYYNGGGSVPSSHEGVNSANSRCRIEDERRLLEGYAHQNQYSRVPQVADRLVSYPPIGAYLAGRGGHRGHPYERKYIGPMRGHSMFM